MISSPHLWTSPGMTNKQTRDAAEMSYFRFQAIHEDEDENMEQGVEHIASLLGDDKMYLYPSILQLVMADGVFAEGQ